MRYVPCWGYSTGDLAWLNIAGIARHLFLEKKLQPNIFAVSVSPEKLTWSFAKGVAGGWSLITLAGAPIASVAKKVNQGAVDGHLLENYCNIIFIRAFINNSKYTTLSFHTYY